MEQILAALRQLDPLNDDHWTTSGDPRIDVVQKLAGVAVDRKAIVGAAPDFNRQSAAQPESLLMNKAKEDDLLADPDEAAAAEAEPEHVDSAADAILSMFPDGLSGQILDKLLNHNEPLKSKEISTVLGDMEPEDVEILRDAIDEKINELNTAIEKSKVLVRDIQMNRLAVSKHLSVVKPDITNQQVISEYLKAQNASRFAAAKNRQQILRHLGADSISPLSAVDQAMLRRNDRGKKRPVYPKKPV